MKDRAPNSCRAWRRSPVYGLPCLIRCSLFLALVGCSPTSFLITPVPEKDDLVERVLSRDSIW
ncbi:MAG: hypothetical protein KKI02_04475, partial [Planctomycetes bacterium]|nr:hypothetical protein [Planctomycetota bacterium]